MKSMFIKSEMVYDGGQLRSLFAYLNHGLKGDSIVSWIGPCDVSKEHMVDGEDLLAGETIAGARMVHFIVEKFALPIFSAVALQRLFAGICLEILREQVEDGDVADELERIGDDLYFGPGKLSISIATVSPVSALIHFAVNVTNDGTPVRTAALSDLDVDVEVFARAAMKRFSEEVITIEEATTKVRWVK